MPKYWGKHIFRHGSFPKWVKSRSRRRRKRFFFCENNGQLCFLRHHRWRTQACLDQKFYQLLSQSRAIFIQNVSKSNTIIPPLSITFSLGSGARGKLASPKWGKATDRRKKKICVNNGQLCFREPPCVMHASCLDQKSLSYAHKLKFCEIFSFNFSPCYSCILFLSGVSFYTV